jgi:hypothetical protein
MTVTGPVTPLILVFTKSNPIFVLLIKYKA